MQPTNPYQAPRSTDALPSEYGPRLFSPKQAGIATFLGSAAAGGIVLGLNAWRQGKPMHAVGYGLTGAVLVGLLIFVLPDSTPSGVTSGLNIGLAFGASALAKPAWESQPPPRDQSNWSVAGVILGTVLFLAATFVGWMLITEGKKAFISADSVDVPGGTVMYWDDVSERNARTLAEYLAETQYFDPDEDASVLLEREDGTLHVCFFVQEGSWNESEVLEYYGDVAADIDDVLFDSEAVQASLCNADYERRAVVYPRN